MKSRIVTILICLATAACAAATPPPDTAQLPQGAFGTADNDVAAINLAASAFASSARTRDNPVEAARAAAAVDFLAGQLSAPRWLTVSPLVRQQMLQARVDVRQVLGIAPDAPSQTVVNTLLQFASAWQSGNQPAAMQVLATPVFTQTPQQTLQILSNLPTIRTANTATMNASREMLRNRSP